jgi:hypothetical protein
VFLNHTDFKVSSSADAFVATPSKALDQSPCRKALRFSVATPA